MFKRISTRLLQHLIAQNSWADAMLQPFASKSVQFNVGFITSSLVILENGNLAIAGETNIPDATVTIPPSLILRLFAKDETAKRRIIIEGDTHLAAELAKVFANMRWDYEDDLSNLIGDIPANKIGNFGRQTANTLKETSVNIAEMLSEYWQEEMPMIAKKRHVEQFNSEVDTLRADVERVEKKLAKLTQKITTKSDPNGNAVDNTP
ncbi:MAG: SCP2 sterol-binding domain-containing protein [Methylotenera sp.]|jgi:ubiquinone biosynthesis protein UbiJ|uniref:ubiquinone biosynthesis accessory factor UbiJ n=1 Tax=Methylotenera sp. TaxID=2051956 RepID=UPI00271C59F1|nr:SCP2 sterol-binding domain-containing protein [Methylotenera sp.]MDO9393247.1 SCP2 sterol-binding domain-containing protein [Methylotenera sp.]MDP1522979.1 SCP2 sterol-binding domain-containing protein [Methylotenera sp.]